MKTLKTILAIALSLAMISALSACSIKFGGEETWEYSADTKEGCEQLFNDFFEKTFENTNMVVTTKGNGSLVSTETIDGTSDCITYATTGAETYSFIKDEEYIYALTCDGSNCYMVGTENYGHGYRVFKNSIDILDALPADGVTYACEVKGSSEDGNSTNSLTLEFSTDEGSVKITAASENDLVKTVTIVTNDGGETRTTEMTFEYGTASVTLPDISDWEKTEA